MNSIKNFFILDKPKITFIVNLSGHDGRLRKSVLVTYVTYKEKFIMVSLNTVITGLHTYKSTFTKK